VAGSDLRRSLVLTGGPAVGKSTTGHALARRRPRAAFVDADDVRQLVVAGAQPLWHGPEGAAQHRLGAQNTTLLAASFVSAGFEVVVADVVTPSTAAVYRTGLPGCVIVHLVVTFAEARRRAATRPAWLTDDEFAFLHRSDNDDKPAVDRSLDVGSMSFAEQVDAIDDLWHSLVDPDDPGDPG